MGRGNSRQMLGKSSLQHVRHTIEPVFDERSEVLVLGTMPSPASREAAFFYGHPRNRFWPVLAALFDEPVPENNAERTDLLLRHHIALWDVLSSCDIHGASDASIANARPNDLSRILDAAPVERVFCTGATSARLYRQLCEERSGLAATQLPSTSPANAAWSMSRLIEAYRPVAAATTTYEPPVLDVVDVVALEQAIAAAGTPLDALMRRAGRFLAYEARKLLETGDSEDGHAEGSPEGDRGEWKSGPVVIFCGNGNNGGDGWVAAEYLAQWGIPVCVVTALAPEALAAEPARSAALAAQAALSGERHGALVAEGRRTSRARTDTTSGSASPSTSNAKGPIRVAPEIGEIETLLSHASLIIDAILGTGFSRDAVREPFASWIRLSNIAHAAGTPVVSADAPSGLSAQTGIAADDTVQADLTVTMIASKPGLEVPGSAAYCGRVKVAPIAYIEPFFRKPSRSVPHLA